MPHAPPEDRTSPPSDCREQTHETCVCKTAGGREHNGRNKHNQATGRRGGATGAGQAKAALQVFAGGACYGAMATTYKLAYAAGFTSAQVVASQAWLGCLFFALAALAGHALGHRWQRVGWKLALKLMGTGALTCLTSILYCYAMSVLPALWRSRSSSSSRGWGSCGRPS